MSDICSLPPLFLYRWWPNLDHPTAPTLTQGQAYFDAVTGIIYVIKQDNTVIEIGPGGVGPAGPPGTPGTNGTNGVDATRFPRVLTTSLTMPTNEQIVISTVQVASGGTLTINGQVTVVAGKVKFAGSGSIVINSTGLLVVA